MIFNKYIKYILFNGYLPSWLIQNCDFPIPIDWFKGQITWDNPIFHHISWENLWFPVEISRNPWKSWEHLWFPVKIFPWKSSTRASRAHPRSLWTVHPKVIHLSPQVRNWSGELLGVAVVFFLGISWVHIYIYTYIHSHPGLDRIWNFQRSLPQWDDFLESPYSIYFRMTIYTDCDCICNFVW